MGTRSRSQRPSTCRPIGGSHTATSGPTRHLQSPTCKLPSDNLQLRLFPVLPRLSLAVIAVVALLVPLGLRPVATAVTAGMPRGYLPALESFRDRVPYDPTFREDVRRINPQMLFIGDSMLGSRIDPTHMRRMIKRQTWWVMQPGTGSAWWYLAFKNHVLATGVRPKVVFVFFRDYNLTDLMFRLDEHFRWSIDTVAGEREPELNDAIARRRAGGWSPVHALVDAAYQAAPVRARAEQWLSNAPLVHVAGERRAKTFQKAMNDLFGFEHLRPMPDADMAVEQSLADFDEQLPQSILPEFVSLAREHGVKFVGVRVKRRPGVDGVTPQSDALEQYVEDLRVWLESQGGALIDDTDDPVQTLDWYKDGDHMLGSKRRAYTERFAQRAATLVE
jgi:hypothetical protein